jgi:hypothetical protein
MGVDQQRKPGVVDVVGRAREVDLSDGFERKLG